MALLDARFLHIWVLITGYSLFERLDLNRQSALKNSCLHKRGSLRFLELAFLVSPVKC